MNATQAVYAASPKSVVAAARRLGRYLEEDRWLGKNNTYARDPADLIKRHGLNGTINSKHLSEYIAASSVVHVADGWSYLGAAFDAMLRGNEQLSIHLSYYAELRAAIALLATRGLGIFKTSHVVIDGAGEASIFSAGGTHAAVWEVLEGWARTTDASDLLGVVVRPEGVALEVWVSKFGKSGAAWRPLAQESLLTWGVDLDQLKTDRGARNEASYRPRMDQALASIGCEDVAEHVADIWQSLEPGVVAFRNLDRLLLRSSLEIAFRATTGRTHRQSRAQFRSACGAVASSLLPLRMSSVMVDFLTRKAFAEDPRFIRASRESVDRFDSEFALGISGRATLLLRLATGSVRHLLASAGFSALDYEFWERGLSNQRGIHDSRLDVPDMSLDWINVADALDQLDSADSRSGNHHAFLNDVAGVLPTLAGLERACLWGLAG